MGADNQVNKVILFDGLCNLCSASVQFIIARDKQKKFRFASLQSNFAKRELSKHPSVNSAETIVLLKNEKIFVRSSAALEIARDLSGAWPALYVFKMIPPFIRDFFYNFIAKKRYAWWGKKSECMIPTPELKHRFIEV